MNLIPFAFILLIFIFQIATIRSELTSDYFVRNRNTGEDWFIHHDEKIALSDARYLYLKRVSDIDIWDFLPQPISVAFGIIHPLMMFVGFKLFGLNNLGLRISNLIVTTFSNVLIVLCVIESSSGLVGIILSLIFILNWNHFILTRHSVTENILTLYLVLLVYIFLFNFEFFNSHIFWIAFFSSSIILFKINFPFYILLLILCFTIPMSKLSTTAIAFTGCFVGFIFFEIIQMTVLNKYGLTRWRYSNFFTAVKVHSGRQKSMGVILKPLGMRVIFSVFNLFIEWMGIKRPLIKIRHSMTTQYFIAGLIISFLLFLFAQFTNVKYLSIFIFIIVYVMSMAPFHFYLKRIVSIFPIIFISISALAEGVISHYPFLEIYVLIFIFVLAAFIIYHQITKAIKMFALRTKNIENFSKDIETTISDSSRIYSHCYGFRFLWMVQKHRFMFADDNTMNNQEIIDWAIKEQARYVIITTGGLKIKEHTLPILIPIKIYTTTPSDSDIPEGLVLCEINL